MSHVQLLFWGEKHLPLENTILSRETLVIVQARIEFQVPVRRFCFVISLMVKITRK